MGKVTKEQSIINEAIADMQRQAEATFKSSVTSKLQAIAAQQVALKQAMANIERLKKELKELSFVQVNAEELT